MIGLHSAVRSVQAQAPFHDQVSAPVTVVVQPGDTLFKIAVEYGVTVDALVAANHLNDASHIEAGQVLVIPAVTPIAGSANAAAPVYAIPYTVQQGDTLRSIALRYGITAEALAAANGITDPNRINVGQALVVPSSQPPTVLPTLTVAVSTTIPTSIPTSVPTDTPTNVPTTPPLITITPTATLSPTATPIGSTTGTLTGSQTEEPITATLSPYTIVPATLPPSPTATHVLRTYTVVPGDQLSQIAEMYGVSWTDIATLNSLSDPNLIYSGLVLKIPDSDVNPPATPIEEPPPISNPITLLSGDLSGKQIVVVLHEQRVYFYQDGQFVKNVSVSTGLPGSPTVIGHFHIYQKLPSQLMVGPGYYLPDVPWVMYFYEGYGLHGTYWHHNWGHPMSHGCVNMPTDEAAWLYNWSSVGTPVTVLA